MLTLAIDTSNTLGSIALLRGEVVLAERVLQLGQAHGQSLIPGLQQLFNEQQLRPNQCELIAVGVGPGSFTGLRVGIVCAKTWAYATGCPLVGVSTFAAIAGNAPARIGNLQVIADAQRGDLFAQGFHREASDWTPDTSIRILPATTWKSELALDAAVIGPGIPKVSDLVGPECHLLSVESNLPLAAWIGRLGVREAIAGRFSDPWKLEPLYLRRSSAEDTWDARAAARKSVAAAPCSSTGPATSLP